MRYQRKENPVDAIKLLHPMTMERGDYAFHGKPGDYLVHDGDAQYFMEEDAFFARFQPETQFISRPWLGHPNVMPASGAIIVGNGGTGANAAITVTDLHGGFHVDNDGEHPSFTVSPISATEQQAMRVVHETEGEAK